PSRPTLFPYTTLFRTERLLRIVMVLRNPGLKITSSIQDFTRMRSKRKPKRCGHRAAGTTIQQMSLQRCLKLGNRAACIRLRHSDAARRGAEAAAIYYCHEYFQGADVGPEALSRSHISSICPDEDLPSTAHHVAR